MARWQAQSADQGRVQAGHLGPGIQQRPGSNRRRDWPQGHPLHLDGRIAPGYHHIDQSARWLKLAVQEASRGDIGAEVTL